MVRVALSIPSPWHMLGCGLTLTRRGCPPLPAFDDEPCAASRRHCTASSDLRSARDTARGEAITLTRRSVVQTEEGDVPYWAHCVSILRFLRKGKLSREEAKVWEGEKGERTDLRQCVRAGSVTMHHVPLTLTFPRLPTPYPLL